MIKTIIKEIKKDIKNDYQFMEYEVEFGDYDLTIIMNRNHSLFEDGDILVYGTTGRMEFSMVMSVLEFMDTTEENFIESLNATIYFMATEI